MTDRTSNYIPQNPLLARQVACCETSVPNAIEVPSRSRPPPAPEPTSHLPQLKAASERAACEARNLLLISMRSSQGGAARTHHRHRQCSSRAVAEHRRLVGSAMGKAAVSWRVDAGDKLWPWLRAVGGGHGGLWVALSSQTRAVRRSGCSSSSSRFEPGVAGRGDSGLGGVRAAGGEGARGRRRRGTVGWGRGPPPALGEAVTGECGGAGLLQHVEPVGQVGGRGRLQPNTWTWMHGAFIARCVTQSVAPWARWEGSGKDEGRDHLQLPLALERVVSGHEVEAVGPVGVEYLGLVAVPG